MTKLTLHILLLGLTIVSVHGYSINALNAKGLRNGFWCLDKNNQPVEKNNSSKEREGYFFNGRKTGVWTLFYPSGRVRLIGEYKDNRPNGAYFKFDDEGTLLVASNTNLKESKLNIVDNRLFTCKMNFDDKETVAGQIFFKSPIFVNNSFQFWNTTSIQSISKKAKNSDFSWFDQNKSKLYELYLAHRNPNSVLGKELILEYANIIPQSESAEIKREKAPRIISPRTAPGVPFLPNGWNKLYTQQNEIWMDGLFKESQLWNGKVFVYDSDGVLLKVRVFQNGEYLKDGVL